MKNQSKLKSFLKGMASINLFPAPLSDPFNGKTDEELIREDWAKIVSQDPQYITVEAIICRTNNIVAKK